MGLQKHDKFGSEFGKVLYDYIQYKSTTRKAFARKAKISVYTLDAYLYGDHHTGKAAYPNTLTLKRIMNIMGKDWAKELWEAIEEV